jgi:hypothetical protein
MSANPRSVRSSEMKKAREEADRKRDEAIQKEKDLEKAWNTARYKQGVKDYSRESVSDPPGSAGYKIMKFLRTNIGDKIESLDPDKYVEGPDAGQRRARKEYLGYKKGGAVRKNSATRSSVSRRADGIASRGKTRGKFV